MIWLIGVTRVANVKYRNNTRIDGGFGDPGHRVVPKKIGANAFVFMIMV